MTRAPKPTPAPKAGMPPKHVEEFEKLLTHVLTGGHDVDGKRVRFNSIAEAVPGVFSLIQSKSRPDYPLRRYSEGDFKAEAVKFPEDVKKKLNGLCNIPDAIFQPDAKVFSSNLVRIFKTNDDQKKFLEDVLADPSRPRLAAKYDVEMPIVPLLVSEAVKYILKVGSTQRRDNGFRNVPKRLSAALQKAQENGPEAELMKKLVYDGITQGIKPQNVSWPYPPSEEETKALALLRPKPAAPVSPAANIQTSWSGADPTRTPTGKPRGVPKRGR